MLRLKMVLRLFLIHGLTASAFAFGTGRLAAAVPGAFTLTGATHGCSGSRLLQITSWRSGARTDRQWAHRSCRPTGGRVCIVSLRREAAAPLPKVVGHLNQRPAGLFRLI
jgi:hypothetical protein